MSSKKDHDGLEVEEEEEEEEEEETTKKNNESNPHHAAQWERQGEWLKKLRAHKQELQAQGVQGFDLLEAMTTLSLDHKISLLENHRCHYCWHDHSHCICSQLHPLVPAWDNTNTATSTTTHYSFKLCILMHHKEYFGAGNSAKLLLILLPNHTELYLFGKRGEVDRLFHDVSSTSTVSNSTMILWPGDDSISVSQFLTMEKEKTMMKSASDSPSSSKTTEGMIHAIVLDGTYTQARNMYKSLRKRWGKQHLPVAVAVNPTTASVFHRAQKNYGKAHAVARGQTTTTTTTSNVLRVSTAEACGLFLTELGASTDLQDGITKAVLLNNQALAFARTNQIVNNGETQDQSQGGGCHHTTSL